MAAVSVVLLVVAAAVGLALLGIVWHQSSQQEAKAQSALREAVALLETDLEPRVLLDGLLDIEQMQGRQRRERWGPRIIDLDILLYADRVIDTDVLVQTDGGAFIALLMTGDTGTWEISLAPGLYTIVFTDYESLDPIAIEVTATDNVGVRLITVNAPGMRQRCDVYDSPTATCRWSILSGS